MLDSTKKILDDLHQKQKQELMLFDEWKKTNSDFKKISEIMSNFKTNETLVLFYKSSPPLFIKEKASEIYKKCLSYRVKLKSHKILDLGYSYNPTPFCIDYNIVREFTDEYQKWGRKSAELWNDVYYLVQDYFCNSGYKYRWELYMRINLMHHYLDQIDSIYNKTIEHIDYGIKLLSIHEEIVNAAIQNNNEMSYFEREIEIQDLSKIDNLTDEEYCFVYTLECELFVFYVGIAANPKERFGQHIRSAFSDESHLFKSKFIQKYINEITQKIIFEGTRRDCKKFEIEYIEKYNPLGNMTSGGEG